MEDVVGFYWCFRDRIVYRWENSKNKVEIWCIRIWVSEEGKERGLEVYEIRMVVLEGRVFEGGEVFGRVRCFLEVW